MESHISLDTNGKETIRGLACSGQADWIIKKLEGENTKSINRKNETKTMIENVTTADCSRPTSDHEFFSHWMSNLWIQTTVTVTRICTWFICLKRTKSAAHITRRSDMKHLNLKEGKKKKNFPWCHTPQQNSGINTRLYVGASCNSSNSLLFIQQPLSWLFTASHNVQLSGSDKMHWSSIWEQHKSRSAPNEFF